MHLSIWKRRVKLCCMFIFLRVYMQMCVCARARAAVNSNNSLNLDCLRTGMCYDPVNNAIWTCVHDYIDQWRNTCQLSNHHASKRLGLPELQYQVPMSVNSDDQQLVSVEETRRVLLQHLGIICCNELAADQKSHHGDEKAPMIDSGFLQCTLQLLTNAVDRDDVIGVQCILMVVEVSKCQILM